MRTAVVLIPPDQSLPGLPLPLGARVRNTTDAGVVETLLCWQNTSVLMERETLTLQRDNYL